MEKLCLLMYIMSSMYFFIISYSIALYLLFKKKNDVNLYVFK